MRNFASFAAIDWSGAVVQRPPGIAVAVTSGAHDVALLRPVRGWTRAGVLHWLLEIAEAGSDMLIGFDLSPTLPFIDRGAYLPGWDRSPPDPRALWALVDEISADEPWLTANAFIDHRAVAPHFRRHGGRSGARFEGGVGRLRVVEQRQRATRSAASTSCFNLVGAAQVGKASLSGMRLFHALEGRIPFWPFDPVPDTGPCIIEIYTTVAARAAGVARGRSKIRDAAALQSALARLDARGSIIGRIDDHATDALVTAAWMRRAAGEAGMWTPAPLTAHVAATEGWTFGVL